MQVRRAQPHPACTNDCTHIISMLSSRQYVEIHLVHVSYTLTAPVMQTFRQFQFASHLYKVHVWQKFNRHKFDYLASHVIATA